MKFILAVCCLPPPEEAHYSTQIGLGLTGFGVFFSFLGIVFFFDKGLIAMGNVIILSFVFSLEFCGSESDEYACAHFCLISDSPPVRFGFDNWSEINYAILHQA
uniref:Uncharacterized protein n=1 Tax=Oryza brachyantha TaxID=4533 RepID=J3M1Z6_ORYBR